MKDKHIITLLLIIMPILAYSQSVEDLVRMARDYNPGLKALNLQYEAALTKADQVNDWPDPKVNLAIGVLPIETRLGAQRFKIGASQSIPWKGLLQAKSNVATSQAEIISTKDELKEIDIEYAIRTAYSTLQFLEGQKIIIHNKQLVLNALGELAKSAVRSGTGKLSNVLFVERKKEALNADTLLIDKKMELPRILINRWTGRELKSQIDIEPMSENELSFVKATGSTLLNHPQFTVLENKITASGSKIALTRYQAKPTIAIGLDYAYIDARNDVDIPGNGRDVLMPMGSISIPIHTGRFKAIRQEETLKQEAIKAEKLEIIDQYTAEIELASSTIEYSEQVISKFQSLRKITNETIKLMRIEYASEGTRFEELLQLEMELIGYDFEILKANYEKNVALATLIKYQ